MTTNQPINEEEIIKILEGGARHNPEKSGGVMCDYTPEQAYCLGNHGNSEDCIGREGRIGDDCKYFKLKNL